MAYFYAQNRRGAKKKVLAYCRVKIPIFLKNLDKVQDFGRWGVQDFADKGPKSWVPFTYGGPV